MTEPRKLKALWITSSFPRKADDNHAPFMLSLADAVADNGIDITVLAPHAPGLARREVINGIQVIRFKYFFPSKYQMLCYGGGILPNIRSSYLAKLQVPFLLISEVISVIKYSKTIRPDVIHAHWIVPQGLVAQIVKKITVKPIIITAHGSDILGFRSSKLMPLIRWAGNGARKVTVNSSYMSRVAQDSIGINNVQIIPMGVDIALFNGQERSVTQNNTFVFMFAGRLIPLKGVNYLIEAFSMLRKEVPEVRLIIVGDGPERRSLEELIQQLGLKENVTFTGGIPNGELPKYYAQADAFVGPSVVESNGTTEAFGVVYLEALASSLPVIATNVGGIRDIITTETGYIVPERNSKALFESMRYVVQHYSEAVSTANIGRRHVEENFGWPAIGARFANLYQETVKK